MNAFFYGVSLQWKMDIRSRTLLLTCYLVPLLFFAVMGGIFTSVMPEAKETLIQSMTVFGVSMGALIGVPTFSCGNLRKQDPAGLQIQRGSGVAWILYDRSFCVCTFVLHEYRFSFFLRHCFLTRNFRNIRLHMWFHWYCFWLLRSAWQA